jgi:hypothetical protein
MYRSVGQAHNHKTCADYEGDQDGDDVHLTDNPYLQKRRRVHSLTRPTHNEHYNGEPDQHQTVNQIHPFPPLARMLATVIGGGSGVIASLKHRNGEVFTED